MRAGALLCLALFLVACSNDDEAQTEVAAPNRIVWASDRDGDFEIYSMRPDGSEVKQLTRNETSAETEADDWAPAWSPDGTRIAFTSTRDHKGDGIQSQELYVMDADGGRQKRLTDAEPNVVGAGWFPDGRIAFATCTNGLSDCKLMAINPTGGAAELLYSSRGVSEFASLSPDGDQLVLMTYDPQADRPMPRIEIADLDGGDRKVLIENGGEPSWSPNGDRLAFVTDRDRNGPCLFHDCTGNAPELYVANGDGSEQRRVTRTTAQEVHPRWSPDGEKLLFARIRNDDEDDYELFVVNADGSCERQLTDNDDWDWMSDWSGPEKGAPLTC